MAFYTYIAACKSNSAIYIGATEDVRRTMRLHATGKGCAHTAKYRIRKLVYFEQYHVFQDALTRAQKLKRWRRDWKNQLIVEQNPNWSDLLMEVSTI